MGRLNTCILVTAIWTLANGHAVLGQTEFAAAQSIPGRVQCEWYASGGEGVAYHDQDSVNNGSGKLNPADGSFLNEFRMREGVDISYTKSKGIDDSPFNKVAPEMGQLYVGWTVVGEWFKIRVNVLATGTYHLELMYTANGDGEVTLSVDDNVALTSTVPSTANPAEDIPWRQWHHWNKVNLGSMKLKKGEHMITVTTTKNGNMNFDYIEFSKQRR